MAVTVVLSEVQRAALAALCDTFAAPVERDDDPTGFWARSASDLQIPAIIEDRLVRRARARGAARRACGSCSTRSPRRASSRRRSPSREAIVKGFMDSGPDALAGPRRAEGPDAPALLRAARPGDRPQPELGGDRLPRPARGAAVRRGGAEDDRRHAARGRGPRADRRRRRRSARARAAASSPGTWPTQGKDVVVLEAGGYYNEADFNQLELWAYENLYRAGGMSGTADGRIALMTGANLGGGSTVNWTNCLRTYPWVREQWERELGLEGLAGPDYDRILDTVSARINVTDRCSDWNPATETLKGACEARGHGFQRITRNADEEHYDADLAGLMGFGDVSGAKNSHAEDLAAGRRGRRRALRRELPRRAGARRGRARRRRRGHVRRRRGPHRARDRARADGRRRRGRARHARPCCCAAASAARPRATTCACTRRPPSPASTTRRRRRWWGPPQSGLSMAMADLEDGYGYLIETSHASPGVSGAAFPWHGGEAHKEIMAASPVTAAFVLLIRDHGHGRVTIDAAGNPVHHYDFDDELDRRVFAHGLEELVRLHEAGGAQRIATFHRAARAVGPRRRRVDRRLRRPRARGLARAVRPRDLQPPPHGLGAHGQGPGDERRERLGRAARHARRLDRRRQRLPDRVGDEPDADDDGARAAHRRGDRGGEGRMTERLERTTGSFEYDGRRLAYDVIGDGERTVVLTHGLLMSRKMHRPAVAAAGRARLPRRLARLPRPRRVRPARRHDGLLDAGVRAATSSRCSTTSASSRPSSRARRSARTRRSRRRSSRPSGSAAWSSRCRCSTTRSSARARRSCRSCSRCASPRRRCAS